MPTNVRDQVATATEQSIIFAILTPMRGQYLSANVLGFLFNAAQRTGFSAVVHAAWEGGIDNAYTMEDHSKPTNTTGEDSENETEVEDEDQLAKVAENEMDDVQDEIGLQNFHHHDLCLDQPDFSAGDDFFEQVGEGSSEDATAPLDDSVIEVIPDRPQEDGIKRLEVLRLCSRICVWSLNHNPEYLPTTKNGSYVMQRLSVVWWAG